MTIVDILQAAQFVVDQQGRPTAVILKIAVWEALLSALEGYEDVEIIQERLKNWPTKEGWTRWQDIKDDSSD